MTWEKSEQMYEELPEKFREEFEKETGGKSASIQIVIVYLLKKICELENKIDEEDTNKLLREFKANNRKREHKLCANPKCLLNAQEGDFCYKHNLTKQTCYHPEKFVLNFKRQSQHGEEDCPRCSLCGSWL